MYGSVEDGFNLVVELCASSSHGCKYDAVVPITKFIFLIKVLLTIAICWLLVGITVDTAELNVGCSYSVQLNSSVKKVYWRLKQYTEERWSKMALLRETSKQGGNLSNEIGFKQLYGNRQVV